MFPFVPSRQRRSINTEFFMQLHGTKKMRRAHAIQCVQLLLKLDPWWLIYYVLKLR
jgi:hypothetical protein